MAHESSDDELLERAALYALGGLDPGEVRAFEEHLSAGCAICEEQVRSFRDTAALLALSAPQVAPPRRLRSEVLASATHSGPEIQVWKSWSKGPQDDSHIVRGADSGWKPVMDGIEAKQLYIDPVSRYVTMLVRMQPGSSYPSHRHGGAEQCFVLEGDIHVGANEILYAGDFQCMQRTSVHDVQWTERGCLLLIVSSPDDELLHKTT